MTQYQLKGSTVQLFQYNPAEVSDYNVSMTLGLPSMSLGLGSFVSFDDVLKENEQKDGFLIERKGLLGGDDAAKVLNFDLSYNIFYFGIRDVFEGIGINVFANSKSSIMAIVPNNILAFGIEGNGGDNLGVVFKDVMGVNVVSYIENGIGLQKTFSKQDLKLGLNVKYILGIGYAETGSNVEASVVTKADTFFTNIQYSDFELNTFLPTDDFDNLEDYMFKGSGFSFDFGGIYDFENSIDVPLVMSVSLLDIFGSITWNTGYSENVEGQTTVIDSEMLDEINQDTEKAKELIFPSLLTKSASYTYEIPSKFLMSFSYKLTERDLFLASNYATFNNVANNNVFALGYTRTFSKNKINLTTNLNHTLRRGINIGFGTSFNFKPIQFYMTTDNLLGPFDVSKLSYLNINFGFNWIFGLSAKSKKKYKNSSPAANMGY